MEPVKMMSITFQHVVVVALCRRSSLNECLAKGCRCDTVASWPVWLERSYTVLNTDRPISVISSVQYKAAAVSIHHYLSREI